MNLTQARTKIISTLLLASSVMATPLLASESGETGTNTLYLQQCAACHGPDRLGGMGPALLPENLGRLKKAEAEKVIREGRPATQMAGYKDILNDQQIAALTDFIYQPPSHELKWGEAEIRNSQEVSHAAGSLPDEPAFEADMMNLFLVVEIGDHHVTLLDGDKMEPIHRFPSRFALHGGPKYSPDGRYVYFGSRDGWITKYDIYNLKVVAEVRAGINMRNIAVSADGNYVLAANYLPHSMVLFDAANLEMLDFIPVENDAGESSRVSAVYTAPPRSSFIAALKDIPEAWEITVENQKAKLRRMTTDTLLDDFFFDPGYQHLIGAARDGKHGVVIDLDTGKTTAELPLPGMLRHYLGIRGPPGDGYPALPGRCHFHHRHGHLGSDQNPENRGPGFLHAQPREFPLRLGRCVLRPQRRQGAHHRQADPGNRQDPATGAWQGSGPCGV